MKRLHIVLGVVALLAVAVSVTAATNLSATAPNQLVVDYVVTLNTSLPGDCPGVAIGDVWYGETDVFAEGTVGIEPQIGEGKWFLVSSEPEGTCGFFGTETFHIFGQGSIEGISTGPPYEGAIVGGTGVFSGASGEYSGIFLGGFNRVTFTFKADLLFLPAISNN